ncbi:MAG TPA: autotransporter-associated beta strand repeat-containing protein, partial [Chthoniobacteraceae bacterium]|nr:autotransporter-associated beta strand repeat-containing protein [Chthoniobacteraceae bacterium]
MTYRPSASCRRFVLASTVASMISSAVALWPHKARAGNTWDGGGAPNANWSTAANWDANTLPDFATPITFAGTTNLTTNNDLNAITVGGIVFDPLADAFTLRGNDITLNGSIVNNALSNQTINLAISVNTTQVIDVAGTSLVIGPGGTGSGVISGAGGITKTGLGALTFGAANTYSGTTTLDGGTVAYTADNTVTSLHFGPVPTATSASTNTTALDLTNANLTASSLTVQSNTSATNTITVGTGKTLTINGAVLVGVSDIYSATVAGVRTAFSVSGSSLVVNGGGGHFTIGYSRSNAATGGDPAATVDLTQLTNFTYNATGGELRIGGGNVAGSLNLANTSNTIVAAQVRIGDSSVLQPGGGNNNGGSSSLTLGPGTNVINANSIIIGATKSHATLAFQDPSLGTLTIAGQTGGESTANITICNATSATLAGGASAMNLDGHDVNIQAGTVIIGRLGGSTGGSGSGSISFDTGTFTAANMQLGVNATGTSSNGAIGTITLGGSFPNDTSAAVLSVTNQFLLANRTNTANTTSPANGTFVINGGTANINADIIDASTTGDPGSRTTTLTLAGGTLNMMGHAIGTADAPITNVNMPSVASTATLANLGGGGINGAGLIMNSGGLLILEGTNSYTGTTTIGPGSTIKVGKGLESGTLGTGDVVNDGTLIIDRTGLITVSGAISGAGNLHKNGTGTVVLSGAGTYTGPTDINQGTLAVTGSITSAVNVNSGGALSGSGNGTTTGKTGNVTMAAGSSLRPGPTGAPGDAGKLTIGGLVVNGGDFQFDLGVAGDLVSVLGTANFTGASTFSPSAAAPSGTYTVLTATTLTLGVAPTVVTPPDTRKTFAPDYTTPNAIKIVVTGNSKSLTWTGQVSSAWQAGSAGPLNWNDGASADRFFNADAVAFGNGPVNRNVAVSGTVAPATVTVNNDAGNDYAFSGGAIGGSASITKSGAGKLTLAAANTHAGGVTLNAGTLNVNHASALGSGELTIAGGSLDNTSGAPVTVAGNNAQIWKANFSFIGAKQFTIGGTGVGGNGAIVNNGVSQFNALQHVSL